MSRIARTLKAVLVVFLSMSLGTGIGIGYARYAGMSLAGSGLLPVRLEAPLSLGGEANKSAAFDEKVVADVYERAAPAVVAIFSSAGQRRGLGSGAIVDASGIVLTNYHVVRGASDIDVVLSDRTHFAGRVLGADPQNDLAVIRLPDAPGGLPTLPLGDSSKLRPGALAIAIGNPNGYERSVTVGVISGLNRTLRDTDRPIRDAIQTDAAINPGNSGGPLLNSAGELIGINTAIETVTGQRGFGGIGFAISAAAARQELDRMLGGETIQHAWLGIAGEDVTPTIARDRGLLDRAGVFIADAVNDSPAKLAGLQVGDVVTAVDGQAIRTMDELGDRLDPKHKPGDTIVLAITRGRERLQLSVTLGTWPDRLRPSR